MPNPDDATERRGDVTKQDTGQRRRRTDLSARQEEFRLFRDKVLLAVGSAGVGFIAISAVAIGVKDVSLALAALATFSTLLGAPAFLRLSERRDHNGRADK